MANVTLGGFRVWGTFTGGEGNIPNTFVREVANNYGTQINKGDIIKGVSDGTVAQASAGDTGSNVLLGVVVGCSIVGSVPPINGKRMPTDFVPANTTFTPSTVGSPNASLVQYVPLTGDVILEVDSVNGTTFNTAAGQIGNIGENCDMTTSGTASTIIGVSVQCLDITTHSTSTKQFRIVDVRGYSMEGAFDPALNDPTSTRFKFLVVCNQGVLPPYTATGV